MTRPRTTDAAQAGLIRGCCLGLIILAALAIFSAVQGFRALADPGLGDPPGGVSHGDSVAVIAATLAGDAATQLVAGEHAVVVLSEHDLTLVALARNPSPNRFRNPQVRIRNGLLVVSAQASVGPFGVTPVARTQLVVTGLGSSPQVSAQVVEFDVGQLGLPQWLGDRLDPIPSATVNLGNLFAANPMLQVLSQAVECVSVKPDGVRIGFHRPGVAADASRCG